MPETDSTPETWKPVTGFEGLYEVSNLGNVHSVNRGKYVPKSRAFPYPIKPNRLRNGYLAVHLYKNGAKVKVKLIHRLVAAAFIGPCEFGKTVNHINSDRADNRVKNLNYMTRSEQNLDSARKGRWNTGNRATPGRQRWHKFSPEQIAAIRVLAKAGWSQITISRAVHISQQYVSVIVRKLKWKHLKSPVVLRANTISLNMKSATGKLDISS